MFRRILLLAPLLGLLATAALAQDEEAEGRPGIYKAVNIVEFDRDVQVTGVADQPAISILHVPPKAKFNPMIQLRMDFSAEMTASADLVR